MLKHLVIVLMFIPLTACAYDGNIRVVQRQSSLATYLYSGKETTAPVVQKKPLVLPIKVGVTFVPEDERHLDIPETTKKQVIESVRSQLASHKKYVTAAYAIPSTYLRPKGGVAELEQVAREFDVDVIVLMAANQFQKHERNSLAAFLDITVIGGFVIPGNTVDTNTVLEAAVYHVPSRALIFRADGSDEKRSRATLFASSGAAQKDTVSSIEDATKKLVATLAESLVKFEHFDATKAAEIRPMGSAPSGEDTSRENYWGRVNEYKTTGGGSFDAAWIAMAGVGLLCAANKRKRCC
ncbi:rhombotarget lipoprotein [Geobacter sp. FeAm09]|uniref:rhombotarget lipoprotein n=1 Tax=Geobacter sp. FeAm09 TaxID=2597769 RepID=UPI00143D5913|nr:rhombotarget lipoprotein [Geobacter sp. FeAm09]